MARRTASALATISVVAASMMFTAHSASAGLVTHCVGSGGAVTVPNDLLVPAGESCSLEGTTVTGNVLVSAGANLVISDGTVNGEVRVAADGYLDTTGTRVDGQVVLAPGGFGASLKSSSTGRVVLEPRGSAQAEGFLFVEDASAIDGDLTAGTGEISVTDSEITGSVSTSGAYFTDLHGTFVDGSLSVLNNATGSVVCGSTVQGRATFAGSRGGVQLGPNGTLDTCASGGYFARDVSISNTSGGRTTVDDNIINGRLQLSANTPAAEVADNNRIRGGVSGEHSTPGVAAATAADTRGTAGQRARARASAAEAAVAAKGAARL
ncbi:hypothetical protein [Saccharothrix coeruleofusca]|uniref:Uncharacterized protein n=1 Tax=Saccharothrix coeruleofusca TaxID=33919 RepID=A0A918AXK6_9PSEU|nr:hypothetical protein [Saccharothrix coeruleofusca]GGP85515.1 hypothetical protein GCM10010185_69120 [Saccharothrix coeruleofusca]